MTDTQPAPTRAKRNGRTQSSATLVSGSKLALYFGVTRQHVDQLTQQGVIERRSDGLFDQDQSRLRYLDHLRSQHRRSPRAEADGELARARAEWLRLRTAERMKELVPAETFDAAIDELAGATLVAMSSIPARLFPYAHNLAERRRCEAVIFQVRRELAAKAFRRAAELEAAEPQQDA
jgi:phage terminase Nu1 subunit (DNA packaging protein)